MVLGKAKYSDRSYVGFDHDRLWNKFKGHNGIYKYNGTFNNRDCWLQSEGKNAIWYANESELLGRSWVIGKLGGKSHRKRGVYYDQNGIFISNYDESIAIKENQDVPICPDNSKNIWGVKERISFPAGRCASAGDTLHTIIQVNMTCKG